MTINRKSRTGRRTARASKHWTPAIVAVLAMVAAVLSVVSGPAVAGEPPSNSDRLLRLVPPLPGRLDADGGPSCAIIDGGDVHCWGGNGSGAAGYPEVTGSIGDDEDPVDVGPVYLGAGRTAIALATGWAHTCAIRDTADVLCWGHSSNGALGYGNTDTIGDTESPAAAGPVDLGPGRTAIAITAGSEHTCAILDDHSVRCWGYYSGGRLGYPYYPDDGGPPTPNSIGDDETPATVGAVDLGPQRTAKAISAGRDRTCAILDDDTVRCWGILGSPSAEWIGDDETPGSAPRVDLGAGRTAKAISVGDGHTCAILDDSTVRCWGEPDYGQLGYPGVAEVIGDDEPAGSLGPVDLGGHTAKAISAGGLQTCAILDDDTVRCWGDHYYGSLGYPGLSEPIGDDETPGSMGPVDIGPGRTATTVSAGSFRTCVAMDNGRVRCWGWNGFGQLGYGNTDDIGDDESPGTARAVKLGGLMTAPTDIFTQAIPR